MHTIRVRMKRGGFINLRAEGHCVRDKDGAGAPVNYIDDLTLYWPRGGIVKPALYDEDQAEEAFWEADEEATREARAEAALDRWERRLER